MTQVDVNTFIGRYPFRDSGVFTHTDLVRELVRTGSNSAWVSNLTSCFQADPAPGNAELYRAHERDVRLLPVPAIHPGRPGWLELLDDASGRGVPAVRSDPTRYGLPSTGREMQSLVHACSVRALPLVMAVRLDDIRQRHPLDVAPELEPAAVRALIRSDPAVRLVITHAERDFIEQVHFGATPQEASRILWDICWIWGPPEDHLELLLETVGIQRFTFGTGMPLRLAENACAKLDLLNLDTIGREKITAGNLRAFLY